MRVHPCGIVGEHVGTCNDCGVGPVELGWAHVCRSCWDAPAWSKGTTCPNCGCIQTGEPTDCRQCHHDACEGCIGADGLCNLCHDIERERGF